MAIYFINTDAKSNNGLSYHDEWIRRRIAVTSGPKKFRDRMAHIEDGDTLLMYVNGTGIVAVGTVTRSEITGETKDTVSPREPIEYHIAVNWHLDLRRSPITPGEIKQVAGQTPLQTVQRVRKGEVGMEHLIERFSRLRG
jgi:hypothetical protein